MRALLWAPTVSSYGLSSVLPLGKRELGESAASGGGGAPESLGSLLIRTQILLDQGSTPTTLFNLNYFPRGPVFKYNHLGAGASTYEF